ncbi:MAG: LysE family translocator [Rhodobacteraceae bacterium]|nr:LysE family translocator [Paracoccaceae bacterium]
MPGPDIVFVFFTAAVALSLAPGPDNIFVLTQSALYGRISGLVVTLGLCTGLMVHTVAVAFGLAAVFAASETAFTAVKLIGAGYLLYLAWQSLRAGQTGLTGETPDQPGLAQLYRRGVIMNITNPKVAIFFLAFLPQFADPGFGALAPQMLGLGLVFILAALLVFGGVSWGAGYLGTWLRTTPKAQIVLNRVAAVVFIGLAVRLLISQR